MNRECNVTKRVQTAKGPRYCLAILSANGRIKPDMVLVNGVPERHPEGAYYLEWYEGKRRVRISVGNNAADAHTRRLRKEAELNAKNHGVAVAPPPSNNGHRLLSVAIAEWLAEIKLTKKAKTLTQAVSMRKVKTLAHNQWRTWNRSGGGAKVPPVSNPREHRCRQQMKICGSSPLPQAFGRTRCGTGDCHSQQKTGSV